MINTHLIINKKNSEQNVPHNIFTLNWEQSTNSHTLINDQIRNNANLNIIDDIPFSSNNKVQEDEIGNIININTNNRNEINQPRKNYFKVVYPQKNTNEIKFVTKKKRKKNGKRKETLNLAKNCLYESCMDSTYQVYKYLFTLIQIVGITLEFSIKDKIGHSYSSNKNFFRMKMKDIFCNSAPNGVIKKDLYKANKRQKLDNILQEEKNNPYQKIKVLNAMFNLYFFDFFSAYLNDESKIIVKNNINGETKVYFYKTIEPENIKENGYVFYFKTYKNCFNDKYSSKLKKKFKHEMIDVILGKKIRRGRRKKLNN